VNHGRTATVQTHSRTADRYVLFDTDIGACGVAWSEQGLTRLQLPEADRSATEKRLSVGGKRVPAQVAPADIAAVAASLQRYMTGRNVDFGTLVLDLDGVEPFNRSIYEAARTIGWGETATYGELAERAGFPGMAREVGRALSRNPLPIVVPCHRILAKGDRLHGFSAYGGIVTKEKLLVLEGLRLI
jgi:methylated-DNA-[protein]-cysteine S-methyltransferase